MPALCYAFVIRDRSHLLIAVACSLEVSVVPKTTRFTALVRVNGELPQTYCHTLHTVCASLGIRPLGQRRPEVLPFSVYQPLAV